MKFVDSLTTVDLFTERCILCTNQKKVIRFYQKWCLFFCFITESSFSAGKLQSLLQICSVWQQQSLGVCLARNLYFSWCSVFNCAIAHWNHSLNGTCLMASSQLFCESISCSVIFGSIENDIVVFFSCKKHTIVFFSLSITKHRRSPRRLKHFDTKRVVFSVRAQWFWIQWLCNEWLWDRYRCVIF